VRERERGIERVRERKRESVRVCLIERERRESVFDRKSENRPTQIKFVTLKINNSRIGGERLEATLHPVYLVT